MKLDSPRKLFALALILGAGGVAAFVEANGEGSYILHSRAKELIALALILGFVFFPWRLFEREYWTRRPADDGLPKDRS